jgi:hypothetical protein
MLSQLPHPVAQLGRHIPFTHCVVPCAFVHAVPHVPQVAVAVSRLASQPFASFPSQSPQPGLHDAIWHVPAAHVAVAFARVHCTPQPPQLASVWASTSQPSLDCVLQSLKPVLQAPMLQIPAAHSGVAFA